MNIAIRHNETGDTLAIYTTTSTAAALARYVRETGLDADATEATILAATGLADCACDADHSGQTIGFTSRDPITNVATVDVFAETFPRKVAR
jgi:hypothetical protein